MSLALVLVVLLQLRGQRICQNLALGVTAPGISLTIPDQAKGPSFVFAEYLKDVLLNLLDILIFFTHLRAMHLV